MAREIAAQRGRLLVWTPVAFGVGAAAYFCMEAEPAAWAGWIALLFAILALASAAFSRRHPTRPALVLAAMAALGFADAKGSTEWSRAPILPSGLGVRHLSGRVVDVVEGAGGRLRLLIAPAAISGLAHGSMPARVRLTLRGFPDVEPGDAVAVLAILDPPPGPASPGGFDFAREAWFSQLGGVGLALTAPRPVALAPMAWPLRLQTGLNALRWRLAERLVRRLGGGPAAGLAAAVSTSHQAWLGGGEAEDLRNSGLAHMLAIAGLHTAAVTGFVYLLVRLGVAAWPWLALRVSGKRWAAAAGLLSGIVYLALSGAHPPARRAAVTAGVAFLAILCGRRGVSLRSLALAALVVLALQPLAVTEPGFQMSFSATAALVALAELWPRRTEGLDAGLPWYLRWPQRMADWGLALAAVSLVAGAATAPFAVQHFNRLSTYGLFANFSADFIASAVLMPALVVCGLGASMDLPSAWMAAPQQVAAHAAAAILAIAHLFASLPGASRTLPSAPGPALAVSFLAIVFAALWRGRLRWVVAPLALAVFFWPRPPSPAAWIAADGDNAAVVEDGRAVVLKPAVRSFASQAWESRRGLLAPFDPQAEADLAFRCDRLSCMPLEGLHPALGAWWGRHAIPQRRLADLCQASDIVMVRGPSPPPSACPGTLLLTRRDFDRGGSAEIYPAGQGWRLVWADQLRGRRPWSAPTTAVGEEVDTRP